MAALLEKKTTGSSWDGGIWWNAIWMGIFFWMFLVHDFLFVCCSLGWLLVVVFLVGWCWLLVGCWLLLVVFYCCRVTTKATQNLEPLSGHPKFLDGWGTNQFRAYDNHKLYHFTALDQNLISISIIFGSFFHHRKSLRNMWMSFSFFQNQGVIILLEKDLYSWGNFGEVSKDQEAPNLSKKNLS